MSPTPTTMAEVLGPLISRLRQLGWTTDRMAASFGLTMERVRELEAGAPQRKSSPP